MSRIHWFKGVREIGKEELLHVITATGREPYTVLTYAEGNQPRAFTYDGRAEVGGPVVVEQVPGDMEVLKLYSHKDEDGNWLTWTDYRDKSDDYYIEIAVYGDGKVVASPEAIPLTDEEKEDDD